MENIRERNTKGNYSGMTKRRLNATDLLGIVIAAIFIPKISFNELSGIETLAGGILLLWLVLILIKLLVILKRRA